MNAIIVPAQGRPRKVFTLPEPHSNVIYPEGQGFWSDPAKAAELWQDCLSTRTSNNDLMEKLAATAFLHGYRTDGDNLYSLLTLAWQNGACAAHNDVAICDVLKLIGNQQALAKRLYDAVLGVKDIAGGGEHPIDDQRRVLKSAIKNSPYLNQLPVSMLLPAVAIAGWLAFKDDHLVTCRIFHEDDPSPEFKNLSVLLSAAADGWPAFVLQEALAREMAMYYKTNQKLESFEVGRGADASLAEARKQGWGVCGFLLDGIARGRDLAKNEPGRALAILEELGHDGIKESEGIISLVIGCELGQAKDVGAWKLIQKWDTIRWRRDIEGDDRHRALRTLRHGYDCCFWFGLLREVNQAGTTLEWMDRARGIPTAGDISSN